eukprot:m.264550 g.264550  ORF g.264550 m.264550 type:complete len:296 (+) comp15618_c0_seq1:358-1245(+)
MSNGGAIPFSSMVDLMQGIHLYQAVATRVRSVVFDSAPCYPSYTAAGGAMCHALGTANPLVHAVVSVLFGVGDTLLRLVRSTQATTYFWHRMQSWAINDKVLERYLVSPTDPLFDFDEGSSLVTHRQKQAPVCFVRCPFRCKSNSTGARTLCCCCFLCLECGKTCTHPAPDACPLPLQPPVSLSSILFRDFSFITLFTKGLLFSCMLILPFCSETRHSTRELSGYGPRTSPATEPGALQGISERSCCICSTIQQPSYMLDKRATKPRSKIVMELCHVVGLRIFKLKQHTAFLATQ